MRKHSQSSLFILLAVMLSFVLTACDNPIGKEQASVPQNELSITLPPYKSDPSESTSPTSEASAPETATDSIHGDVQDISEADILSYNLAVEFLEHYTDGAPLRNLTIRDVVTGVTHRGNAALDYIYKLFTRLNGFGDSEMYLARFVVVEDVVLGEKWITTDNSQYIDAPEVEELYYYQYNALGQLVMYWDLQDQLDYADTDCYFYSYDGEGRIVSIQVSADYDDPVYMRITPNYDDNGMLISEQIEPNPGLITYTYDNNGQLTSKTSTSGSGIFTSVSTTQYLYSGELLTQEVFENYYNLDYVTDRVITDYFYDDTGNLTEKTVTAELAMIYDHPGYTTKNHYSYEFDPNGRIIRELLTFGQTVNPDGSVDEPADHTREIEYIYGDYYVYQFEVLPVTAEYASNSLLQSSSVYDAYRERESDYQVHIAFFANETVTDFQYIELIFDETMSYTPGDCLYRQESLKPSRPLVITTTFSGLLSDRGICFVDASGNIR